MIYKRSYKKNKNVIYKVVRAILICALLTWCAFAYFGYQMPSVKVSKVINIKNV